MNYSTPPGCAELRCPIARRLQARGMDVSEDEVLLTAGGMEALSLSLRLPADPGDLVAVECLTCLTAASDTLWPEAHGSSG